MAPDHPALATEVLAADEEAVVVEFIAFLKTVSAKRHPHGVVKRFNQTRHAGCVEAELIVRSDLPDSYRVGLFAVPATYRASVRFASGVSTSDRDPDIRGMSISVADVPGENLSPGVARQDFLLNSHPVMVAADSRQFLELLRAMEDGRLRAAVFFARHPRLLRIALASRQRPASHLDIAYWSTTPYLFGLGRAVKYSATPCSDRTSQMPAELTADYLRNALSAHLTESEACFDLKVQLQADSRREPIEDATVEWKTPFETVARLRIPRQTLGKSADEDRCERAEFNPWHCLVEHRPLGNVNRARREIYRALAEFRRDRT